jgi:2-oxoglutarate ferredoxin oxidoreductase subunit beta
VVHKLIAEVIEEMGKEDKNSGISPVGMCSVLPTTISIIDWQDCSTRSVLLLWHCCENACGRTALFFTYQATVTWLVSVQPKQSTL